MVLQTSCRCLRQIVKGNTETAVIWLNEENAKTLDKQLKEEQHTSIQELTNLGKDAPLEMINRFSRMEYLKLPAIDFYQLNVVYETIVTDELASPEKYISNINAADYFDNAYIVERGLSKEDIKKKKLLEKIEGEIADFDKWIFNIARESMGSINISDLYEYEKLLKKIFNAITFEKNNLRQSASCYVVFNNLFQLDEIKSRIRLAFHRRRELNLKSEIIPKSANLLVIEKLASAEKNDKLFPTETDVMDIIKADKTGKDIKLLQKEIEDAQKKLNEFIASQENPDLFSVAAAQMGFNSNSVKKFSRAVISKDRTFHYLPYNFFQSRFELKFLQETLNLSLFIESGLELYYNGEKQLTEFRIVCFEKKNKQWRRVGLYTPDFLIIKRKDKKIFKILIVETKGRGFADQQEFVARRNFIESEFLKINNEKFGYNRFDYLYLPDSNKIDDNLRFFSDKIKIFFRED